MNNNQMNSYRYFERCTVTLRFLTGVRPSNLSVFKHWSNTVDAKAKIKLPVPSDVSIVDDHHKNELKVVFVDPQNANTYIDALKKLKWKSIKLDKMRYVDSASSEELSPHNKYVYCYEDGNGSKVSFPVKRVPKGEIEKKKESIGESNDQEEDWVPPVDDNAKPPAIEVTPLTRRLSARSVRSAPDDDEEKKKKDRKRSVSSDTDDGSGKKKKGTAASISPDTDDGSEKKKKKKGTAASIAVINKKSLDRVNSELKTVSGEIIEASKDKKGKEHLKALIKRKNGLSETLALIKSFDFELDDETAEAVLADYDSE